MIYLDHNATTPIHPEVLDAFVAAAAHYGNASSIHAAGRGARRIVEEAREEVARLVNCDPGEIVFTSCGTEADNTAIKGTVSALRERGDHIVTSTVEHPAVLRTCEFLEREGFRVTRVPVDRHGILDPAAVEAAIEEGTVLLSFMFANNETGVLMPVREIGEIALRRKLYFHCDAVQAAGREALDVREMNIHLMALSGHKLNAPKGIGALVVRKGVKLHPLLHGGAQERNRRAGTENVPAIAAFGKACALAYAGMAEESARLKGLRDKLERGILERVEGVEVNGHPELRLANTSNLSFRGVEADSLLAGLDLAGIAASSGSACSSGVLKNSPVLSAMGLDPAMCRSSLRFSLGFGNTEAEIDYVLETLPGIVERCRKS